METQITEDSLEVVPFAFEIRDVEVLKTSKGEVVEWRAVGGYPTFLAIPTEKFVGRASCGNEWTTASASLLGQHVSA